MRGAGQPSFTISTIKYKVVVREYDKAERADTLLLFLFFPFMYCLRKGKNRILHFTVERNW
jgi:hypothetical protein